jgi:hypothetical protein
VLVYLRVRSECTNVYFARRDASNGVDLLEESDYMPLFQAFEEETHNNGNKWFLVLLVQVLRADVYSR